MEESRELIINNFKEYNLIEEAMQQELLLIPCEKCRLLFQVAILEAFNNAVEYGKYPIVIRFKHMNSRIVTRIKDCGKGFPVRPLFESISVNGVSTMMEGKLEDARGRGVLMMVEIADKVIYNAHGNDVILIKGVPCSCSKNAPG
ncbi:ATP-binding protein [Bacillus sp. HMF5848]|uniref:ATP-binding protein n=1 Tax=Bacillus sp. HMF5848 TaxID=2495421 RepID=UPI000F79E7D5|nr:ATP-binding protein [Bacillus sp. HMF5848]RSK26193.1 ATP-binding protein [Bacillus sp. HMF5848]